MSKSRSKPKGTLGRKVITFASTSRVDSLMHISNEFMEAIFDLEPGDYVISDESDLRDFTDFGSSDTAPVWERIKTRYTIEKIDVGSSRLLDILEAIARRKSPQ